MDSKVIYGRIVATYGKDSLFQPEDSPESHLVSANRKAGKAVCGDWVTVDDEKRIKKIQDRSSEYIRPDFRHRGKVLAANVDTLIWLTSHTPPNDRLIAARALLVSRLQGLSLVFIQSKADCQPESIPEHLRSSRQLAQDCDIPWFTTSSQTGQGLDQLLDHIKGKKALIVGQSGVGKSTLVTHLTGDNSIRTQSLSAATGHGRHTTTTAQLYYAAEHDLELIDAPGMRDIGLWQMPEQSLLKAMPELNSVAKYCRFNNCRHQQEPDCAVKEAIENAELSALLYDAYEDALNKDLLS